MATMRNRARVLVALAALAALGIGSLASSVALATGNTRDTNNCVDRCGDYRDYCWAHCPISCSSAYSPGSKDHGFCLDNCTFQCAAYMQFCKSHCNASTDPGDEP